MGAFEKQQQRTERVVILLTPEERAALQQAADESKLSLSEFVRIAVGRFMRGELDDGGSE